MHDETSDEGLRTIEEVRDEIFKMLPAIKSAISRNQAHESLVERLDKLEAEQRSMVQWKMAADVHRLLVRLRHTDMDAALFESIESETRGLLASQGFFEFGEIGEKFNDRTHHLLEKPRDGDRGHLQLSVIHSTGLRWMNRVVVKAKVSAEHGGEG